MQESGTRSPGGMTKMATYYIMKNADELVSKMREIEAKYPEAQIYTSKNKNDAKKMMRADLKSAFINTPQVDARTKAEACAKVSAYCEDHGLRETCFYRPGMVEGTFTFDTFGFVFEEDGKWFQKLTPDTKAKHEVVF